MPRIDCPCGHAMLIPAERNDTACPRCGREIRGGESRKNGPCEPARRETAQRDSTHRESAQRGSVRREPTSREAPLPTPDDTELTLIDPAPSVAGYDAARIGPGANMPAAGAEQTEPDVAFEGLPPIRIDYAGDGRPEPPAGSSLVDPYDYHEPSPWWSAWGVIQWLVDIRAIAVALLFSLPLSCLGFGFVFTSAISRDAWSPVAIAGFLICLPNVLIYRADPSLYLPNPTWWTVAFFAAIQFAYFYMIALVVIRCLWRT